MRKIYGFLMTVAVVATAFISCTNSDNTIDSTQTETPTKGVYRQLAFAADNESGESRTHHTGETIHWSKGDRIRISYTREGVWQNADGREAGAEVAAKLYTSDEQSTDSEFSVFRVTQLFNDPETEGELVFYGLYPSEATKGNKPDFADSEAGLVNVSIPQIQSPSATSFDGMADLLVARSRNTYSKFPTYEEQISMFWTRLVAHGMLTLKGLSAVEGYMDDETIEYVEFEVDPSVALAGDFSLDLAGQTIAPTSAKNKIRLTYADNEEHNTLDGDGNFVVWFASAPFTTKSIAITVATNRAIYTRTFASANKTFKVNTRSLLGINMSGAERASLPMVDMFELVTDASVLAAGKKVVIAAKDFDVAMSTSKSSDYRNQTAIEKDGNFISIDSTVEVFELQEGTVDGTWAFYEPDFGYLKNTGSKSLQSGTTAGAPTNWKVEITDTGIAKVKANSYNFYILYNTGVTPANFRTFSATTNTRLDISLYHNVPSTTPLMSQMSAAPVITTAEETESNIVNVAWTHDLTGMTITGLYYTVTCSMEGEEDVVYSSITETEFVVDNLAAGEWSITVTAHADNHYPITSEPMLVTVLGTTPTLTIEPTELLFEGAGGTQQIEVMAKNLGSNLSITAESDNAAFTTSVSGTTVSVRASKNPDTAERSGKITITAAGSKATLQVEVAVLQEIGQIIYKKVSGTLKDFSGQYLIVCESESVIMKGSSGSLTSSNNYAVVTIKNDQIALGSADNTNYFTIEKSGENYFVKSAYGQYIGKTASGDGINVYTSSSPSSEYVNTISYNGSDMDIVAYNGGYLQFRESDNKFMYVSSITDAYSPIHLYKLEGSGSDEMYIPLATPNVTATVSANTITVSWPEVANAANYIVTCGDETVTVTANSAIFANMNYATSYEISVVAYPADGDDDYCLSSKATATATIGSNPNVGQCAVDVIDLDFTGVSGTSYTAWKGTGSLGAVYVGHTAKGNNAVQMNSSSPAGIVTTSSIGKVSKIIVTWNTNTADGRTLDIYGKNTPYEGPVDVYNSDAATKGTKLGSIVCGTSTEFVIEDDYEHIGLRSNSSTMYIDEIRIVWNATRLATPTVTTTVDGSTVNVSWSEVANAANYTVTCGDEVQTVTGTSASFVNVPYLSTSNVSVVANPVAGSAQYIASAAATTTVEIGANPTTGVEYTFTILPADFPTSAVPYKKTSIATATDGSGARMVVSWTSSGMRLSSNKIYWQKNGILQSTSDLGSVTDVVIDGTATNLTTTIDGGYFEVKASANVSGISSITVTFTK